MGFDSQATQRGLDRAAKSVSDSIDKTANKLASDIQRSTDKTVAAIDKTAARLISASAKDTDKIVASVKLLTGLHNEFIAIGSPAFSEKAQSNVVGDYAEILDR